MVGAQHAAPLHHLVHAPPPRTRAPPPARPVAVAGPPPPVHTRPPRRGTEHSVPASAAGRASPPSWSSPITADPRAGSAWGPRTRTVGARNAASLPAVS